MAILEALVPIRKANQPLQVLGVADLNPAAPGILYACRHNLFVSVNAADILHLPELDVIVNATGRPEVAQELQKNCPDRVVVLSVERPYSWEDFWDLISMNLSPIEAVAPLKIGVVGGGKAGYDVLRLLTGGQGRKRRIEIMGVADLNSQAQGLSLAMELGIPTYEECTHLLEMKPDLILELTGDPGVRERIIQQKDPHTQIIDHVKARLFWDLLHREEDLLRSMIESEIKLAGQRTRFQRIFDHLPDAVLVLNANYLVEDANLTFLKRFQKNPEEVIGRPCFEVFRQLNEPCDRKGLRCPLPEVLEGCQPIQIVQSYHDPDGKTLYDEITMSPLYPPEGTKKQVIEVIKDITMRKQLEDALQMSEETTRQLFRQTNKSKAFLETIVNGIEDHMMVIDPDYHIIDVNRALLEMVGLEKKDVVGKHCYEVSHHLKGPCTIPDHPCPLKDAIATGKAASATHVHFDKDSREHYIHVVCHPLFDEEGRVNRVIDLSRDITQEITARTRMLHDDKMTSLGKLSASVVHEINNPLTGILNFTKLAKRLLKKGAIDAAESSTINNYLDMIYSETSRVSKTVANLLAFSRKTKPEFTPTNINDVMNETLSLSEYQMRLQGITVKNRLASDLLPVLADPAQLKQAFLNLLLNAQDAMPQGGILTLETKNFRRKEVLVQVADTGVGIPKECFSKIFEPFYTTKKAGSGVGLGLSVVYGIVRDHKGSIKVESVVGRGTTFTIRLPAYKPGEESAAA